MAATPWLEILIVIPIGIAMGLSPLLVGIVAFFGNAIPIIVIVFAYERFMEWWSRRKQNNQLAHASEGETEEIEGSQETVEKKESKGSQRGKQIMQKYGLPGLALLGPIITGIHLAVIIAIIMKANAKAILFWMNLSLIIWTVIVTVLSVLGIDFLFAR